MMNRHRFDPLSFVFGVTVIVLTVAVVLRQLDDLEGGDRLWWIAIPVLLVGLAIIPRRRARSADPSE
jgi:hypothetical protein